MAQQNYESAKTAKIMGFKKFGAIRYLNLQGFFVRHGEAYNRDGSEISATVRPLPEGGARGNGTYGVSVHVSYMDAVFALVAHLESES